MQIFKSYEFGQIRTMTMPDVQIGFVGKDVAEALGYANASKAIMVHVDDDDKTSMMLEAHSQNGNLSQSKTTLINESGRQKLFLDNRSF